MIYKPRLSKGVIRQFAVALCASLSAVSAGTAYMWVTPLLKWFLSPESEVPMTITENSWVVNAIEVGDLVTPLPVGCLVQVTGRKPILLLTAPIFIASWALVLATRSVIALYAARFIQGMAVGMMFAVLPIYLGEIADTKIRGCIGTLVQSMWYVGIVFTYATGALLEYQTMAWVALLVPILLLVTFVWLPESPYYLVMRGKEEAALKNLIWLRGKTTRDEVAEELQEIVDSIKEEEKNKASWKDLLATKAGRKAFFLIQVTYATSLMGGLVSMLTYVSFTFGEISSEGLQPRMYTLGIGIIILAVVPIASVLLDRAGRRPVLFTSEIVGFVSIVVATVFFYLLKETSYDVSKFSWVGYTSVTLYMVAMTCGVEAVIPVLQAELFPSSTRAIASAIGSLSITIFSFVSLVIFQQVIHYGQIYYNFIIFAFFIAFGFVIHFFNLPETKGKTFSEIQKTLI